MTEKEKKIMKKINKIIKEFANLEIERIKDKSVNVEYINNLVKHFPYLLDNNEFMEKVINFLNKRGG